MVTIAAMLLVWPVHPFREVVSVRSGDEGHEVTKPLEIGESMNQYFRAPDDNLIQLEYVLTCEDGQPQEGELLFEFLDDKGTVLYEQVLDYGDIPDYGYGGVILNLKVKKGRIYAYRLTNISITENMPCGVYTADPDMQCLKKGRYELAGEEQNGELLTRLTTNSPITAENTIAIWGCISMIGFTVYEAFSMPQKKERKRETV